MTFATLSAISRLMHRNIKSVLFDQLVRAGEASARARRAAVVADCITMLTDQAEQETHVAAVGSAFRRLGSIGPPHLAQVPYVPSDIRFRAASI